MDQQSKKDNRMKTDFAFYEKSIFQQSRYQTG